MRDSKSLLKLVQDAIDNGATTAEDVHKAIARLPLKVLAEVGALRKPMKEADRLQDIAIGALYDLIREINERVAKYAVKLLAKAQAGKGGKAAAPKRKPATAQRRRAATKRTATARNAAPRKKTTRS